MRPKITRTDYLVKFFANETAVEDVETLLHAYPCIYGTYLILKPFELDSKDLLDASYSDDRKSVTIQLADEKLVKTIKKKQSTSFTMCGEEEYNFVCTVRGKFITYSFDK